MAGGFAQTAKTLEEKEDGRYTADELQLSEKDEKLEDDSNSFDSNDDSNQEADFNKNSNGNNDVENHLAELDNKRNNSQFELRLN